MQQKDASVGKHKLFSRAWTKLRKHIPKASCVSILLELLDPSLDMLQELQPKDCW